MVQNANTHVLVHNVHFDCSEPMHGFQFQLYQCMNNLFSLLWVVFSLRVSDWDITKRRSKERLNELNEEWREENNEEDFRGCGARLGFLIFFFLRVRARRGGGGAWFFKTPTCNPPRTDISYFNPYPKKKKQIKLAWEGRGKEGDAVWGGSARICPPLGRDTQTHKSSSLFPFSLSFSTFCFPQSSLNSRVFILQLDWIGEFTTWFLSHGLPLNPL